MSFAGNVMVAIDQLGNALAGGNPDSTISARIGYFSNIDERKCLLVRKYWRFLEIIVNYTFYPIDGKGHCAQAYISDPEEDFENGSDFTRAILAGMVIIFCPVIGICLRLVQILNVFKNKG